MGLKDRMRRLFRERQIFIRSAGRVRFFVLSPWAQGGVAALVAAALLGAAWGAMVLVRQDDRLTAQARRIAELDQGRRELTQDLLDAEARTRSVAAALEVKYDQLRQLLAQRESLESRLGQLTETLRAIARERDSSTAERIDLGLTIDTLNRDLAGAAERERQLRRQLADTAGDLSRMTAARDAERRKGTELASRIEELESDLDRAYSARGDLSRIVAETRDRMRTLAEERQAIERGRDELRDELQRTRDRLSLTQAARADLTRRLSRTRAKVAGLATALGDLTAERDTLGRQVASLQGDLSRTRQAQRDLLEQIYDQTGSQVGTLVRTIAKTGLDVAELLAATGAEGTGLGGPFVAIDPDLPPASEFHEAKTDARDILARVEARLGQWSALRDLVGRLPLGQPTDRGYVASAYGKRRDPMSRKWSMHSGLDISAAYKTPVLATAPGRVTFAGWRGPYGRLVEIDHGNGFKTRYGHLTKLLVKKGDRVSYRARVGLMGSTGRSTGSHVHYEVEFQGRLLDPANFIEAGKNVFQG